jgi:hypothetical protein
MARHLLAAYSDEGGVEDKEFEAGHELMLAEALPRSHARAAEDSTGDIQQRSVRLVLVQTLNRNVQRVAGTGTGGSTGLLGESHGNIPCPYDVPRFRSDTADQEGEQGGKGQARQLCEPSRLYCMSPFECWDCYGSLFRCYPTPCQQRPRRCRLGAWAIPMPPTVKPYTRGARASSPLSAMGKSARSALPIATIVSHV